VDERRALMAAIIANPDEDTPRLALADWLDENGDKHDKARAVFIRCQITAARGGPDAKAATTRASKLRSGHLKHWVGPLAELLAKHRTHSFARGMYEEWFATAGDFLKKPHQAAVCERFPLLGVETLYLRETTKRVDTLAQSPALAWVAKWHWMDAKIEDNGFVALARSPYLERLSQLVIDKPRCSDAGLKALAKSKGLPNLRVFGLWDGLWRSSFTADGVRVILDSDRFPKLDELDLSHAHTHRVTDRALFTYTSLSRLRVLKLGFDTNTTALAKCPHLTNLEELHVAESDFDDDAAHALADNAALAHVKVITLTDLNANCSPLGAAAERALRDRFGDRLVLEYSILCHEEEE
jgi:uncharacterized protein (TIGR02996 family)